MATTFRHAVDGDSRLERLFPRSMRWFPRQFFLSLRLATRLGEAITALLLGSDHRWSLVVAAAGCAAYDLRLAAALDRADAVLPGRRLLLDTADVALWTLALPGAGDLTAIAASPLAFDVAFRYGWYGLLVPITAGTVADLALHLAHRPMTALTYLWPAISAIGGVLAAVYLRSRWRRGVRLARDSIEAAAGQAELSGQNSVAMGADSVVDLLVRTAPLIAAYESRPAPFSISAWKASLAEASGSRSTYLGSAITRWQRRYNGQSPDLSADVDLRVRHGAGVLLLSRTQTQHLEARLDELRLRGTVPVEVPRLGPVGEEQLILVGGRPIVIPADPRPRHRPLQLAPFAFVLGAVLTLLHSQPPWRAVPVEVTVPLALAMLAAAWWIHRQADRAPTAMAWRTVLAGLMLGGVDAIVSSAAMRADSGRVPWLACLQWVAPLIVASWVELTRRRRAVAVIGLAVAVTCGIAVMPVEFSALYLAGMLVWPLASVFAVRGLRDVVTRDGADLSAELARLHDTAVRDGFGRGRRLVVDLTAAAAEQLRRRYHEISTEIPREIATEIERRLAEARTSLAALGAE